MWLGRCFADDWLIFQLSFAIQSVKTVLNPGYIQLGEVTFSLCSLSYSGSIVIDKVYYL